MVRLIRQNQASPQDQIFNPLMRFHKEMSNVINDFYDMFEPSRFNFSKELENLKLLPAMDIMQEENNYKVELEMPGMSEEDIKVSISENMLIIEGEKTTTAKKDDKKNYVSREITYGHYERSISLPQNADSEKATASFKKGILCITIPKKTDSKNKPRKINVEKAK